LVNGEGQVVLGSTGTLTLPEGGTIAEGFVTDNPTIELTPANPDDSTQKLVIKGGVLPEEPTDYHLHLTTGDLSETSIILGTDNHNVRTTTDGGISMTTTRGTVLFGNTPDNPVTGSSHFHIMKDDAANVDLFFGDDYNYVKLPSTQGVEVGANGSIWEFGTDGGLTIPGDIRSEGNINIDINLSDSTLRRWSFGEDGHLIFPGGTNIIESSADSLGIYSNNPTRTNGLEIFGNTETNLFNQSKVRIISNVGTVNRVWEFGTNGSLTFPDATVQTTAFTTSPTLNILKIDDGVHEKFQELADATGTVTHDCSAGNIFYHSSPDANWTVNLTNLNLSESYATTVTIIIDQGNTGYYPSALQVGGAAQTINWQGNTTPTPSTNRLDVVSFSILAVSGGYIVFGQLTGF
jgi:hypothetical protein